MCIRDSLNPVQGNGEYAASLPLFGGLNVWKAKNKILDTIAVTGNLLSRGEVMHSYMHCWRHKTPLIYRATNQWFIRMDEANADTQGVINENDPKDPLRKTALEAVEATQFVPEWGEVRLHNMIANRPDWCISRQRNWGVPLPFLIHKETGKLHPETMKILNKVADVVEKEGIEAWTRLTPAELTDLEPKMYEKSKDTLDVWFDSGTTHMTVMRGSHADKLTYPADLYLEGSDQHRGWFHSSLLTGCAIDGRAPYKGLLTHGFTVDEQGRKMSKSLGNCIYLSESEADVKKKIMSMYTDPNHLRVQDPGKVEGNPVFIYLDAFSRPEHFAEFLPEYQNLDELKAHYQRGGLGDVKIKKFLNAVMQAELEPIRNRRKEWEQRLPEVVEILKEGSAYAEKTAAATLDEVRKAMRIDYFENGNLLK